METRAQLQAKVEITETLLASAEHDARGFKQRYEDAVRVMENMSLKIRNHDSEIRELKVKHAQELDLQMRSLQGGLDAHRKEIENLQRQLHRESFETQRQRLVGTEMALKWAFSQAVGKGEKSNEF